MVLCTTVLFALMAGFFYSFSVTVMPGLDLVSSSSAIEAMQGINRAVRNPVFFVTFMVTPILACALAVLAWFSRRRRTAVFLLLAAASYIAGVVVPTGTINVPMNDVLASVDASAAALQVWTQYSADWTLWNTLRTLPSILALLLCTAAYGAVQEIAE
jgi:uncharacterized membrane protein